MKNRSPDLFDNDGFLLYGREWDRGVAEELARFQGIGDLKEDHWKVIDYIRAYYLEHDRAPMIRKLCQVTKLSLGQIYALFPLGPAEGACKIAGLKKLDGCS